MSIPFLSREVIKFKMKSHQNLLDNLSAEELEENENLEADYDYSAVEDIDERSIFAGFNQSYENAIVGHIIIPDLNINLPILKGTTEEHLTVGATTMKSDQKMGEGNYPLAGHYMKNKDLLFGSLLDIEKDTIVRITNKKMIYEYKIYETLLVPDTSVHLLDDKIAKEHGKPIISLMGCYYTSKNKKRFFAFGELVDEYPYDSGRFIQ